MPMRTSGVIRMQNCVAACTYVHSACPCELLGPVAAAALLGAQVPVAAVDSGAVLCVNTPQA